MLDANVQGEKADNNQEKKADDEKDEGTRAMIEGEQLQRSAEKVL